MLKTDAGFLHVHSSCCSSSVLCRIVLAQPGGAVPPCLPSSCTATLSCLAVSSGASLETPAWSMTQKPGESRTPTVSGLYRFTSQPGHTGPQPQPGAQHQLNWDYPTVEAAASHLTLAVLSAGQQSVASCSPWATQYAGLHLIPTLTISEQKGPQHFQAAFSWSQPLPDQRGHPRGAEEQNLLSLDPSCPESKGELWVERLSCRMMAM